VPVVGERVAVVPEVGDHVVDVRPEFGFRTGTVTGVIWPEGVLYVQPDGVPGEGEAVEFNVDGLHAALLDYGVYGGVRRDGGC
jgi:hypothetical protein